MLCLRYVFIKEKKNQLIIQKNISLNISDYNNNFLLGKPTHLIEAIRSSKNYKKMIEEQEKSKNEKKKIKRSNISFTNKKIQISGGSVISGFAPEVNNIKDEDSSNKILTNNGNDINDINQNNTQNNEKYSQLNDKYSHNNEKYLQNNEKYDIICRIHCFFKNWFHPWFEFTSIFCSCYKSSHIK